MPGKVDKGSTPSALRLTCRTMLARHLPTLGEILTSASARDQDKIKSLELLGKFGLGAADSAHVHVHAEGNVLVGVVALPALGEAPDYEAFEAAQVIAPQALTSGEDP